MPSVKRTPLGPITSILKNHNEGYSNGAKPLSVRAKVEQLESHKRKKDNQRRLSFRTPPPNDDRRKSTSFSASSTVSKRVTSSLKKEVQELRSHVHKLDGENMDKDELLLLIQGKDHEIDLQAEELSSLNEKLSKIQGGLRDIDSERQALTVKVDNLEVEKRDLTEQLSRREKEVNLLARRIESQSSKTKDANAIHEKNICLQELVDEMTPKAESSQRNMALLQELRADMEACERDRDSIAEKLRGVEFEREEALENFRRCSEELKELVEEKGKWEAAKQQVVDEANERIQAEQLRHQTELTDIRSQLNLKNDQLRLLERRIKEDERSRIHLEKKPTEEKVLSPSDIEAVESTYSEDLEQIRQDLKNKENVVDSLVQEIGELNRESAESQEAFEHQLASVKAHHDKSISDLREQHKARVAQLEEEKRELEEMSKNFENGIKSLKKTQYDEVELARESMNNTISSYKSSLNHLKEEALQGIAKLRGVLEEKHANILFLENEIQEMDRVLTQLQAHHEHEIETLTADHLRELQTHREEEKKAISNLNTELKAKDALIKRLEDKTISFQTNETLRDQEHARVVAGYKSTIEKLEKELKERKDKESKDSHDALLARIEELEETAIEAHQNHLDSVASMEEQFAKRYQELQEDHEKELLNLEGAVKESFTSMMDLSSCDEIDSSTESSEVASEKGKKGVHPSESKRARFQNVKELLSNIREKHTSSMVEMKDSYKEEMRGLHQLNDDLQQEICEKDAAIERMENDVSQLRRALQLSPANQLRSEVSSLRQKVASQERELVQMNETFARMENENMELQKNYSDEKQSFEEQIHQLKDTLEALQEEKLSLKSNQEKEIWSKEQDLLEKDSVIALLRKEAADHTKLMMELQGTHKQESDRKSVEVTELANNLESLAQERDKLLNKISDMEAEDQRRQEMIAQSSNDVKRISQDIEGAKRKACLEKEQYNQSLLELEQKSSEQESGLIKLRHELAKCLEDLMTESARAELAKENAKKLTQLEFEYEALKNAHEQLREDLFEKRVEMAHLEAEILKRDIEKEFASGRNLPETATSHAELESLRQAVHKLEEALRRSKSELEDECIKSRTEMEWRKSLQLQCANLESTMASRKNEANVSSGNQEQLAELQRDLDDAKAVIQQYCQREEKINSLEDKFVTAKSSISAMEAKLTELEDIQKEEDALWNESDENNEGCHEHD